MVIKKQNEMQRRRTCNRDHLAQEAENIYSLALSRKFADPCMDRLTFIYLIFCWWAFWGGGFQALGLL